MTFNLDWLWPYVVRFGLWLAEWAGHRMAPAAPVPDLLTDARLVVEQVEEKFKTSDGGVKHREALRMLINRHPDTKERMLNYAIEYVIQKYV